MSRAGPVVLVSLALLGAAPDPPRPASDLAKFRYQPAKIRVNEVAHYVKSNLNGSKPTRRKAAPKYRGPNGETWAGRGVQPRWLVGAIRAGKRLEDFRIDPLSEN